MVNNLFSTEVYVHRTKAWLSRAFILCLLKASSAEDPLSDLDSLRYNEVQFKGAHNSIDRDESISAQLDWDSKEPHQGGCRGIELDIVQDPKYTGRDETWVFGVQHGGPYTPATPGLVKCLREVRSWSESHPRHHVVTIHIDLKEEATLGEDKIFVQQIDEIFAGSLGKDRIFRPSELKRDAPSLLAGVEKYGWPELKELRGRCILVFSGSDGEEAVQRRRRAYYTTDPRERFAFVDLDQRAAGAHGADECDIKAPYYNEGSRVFVNIELGRKDWTRLGREAHQRGFVTREWKANDEASWRAAREAGINILTTDRIRNYPWASVGARPFAPLVVRKSLKVSED